MIKKPWWFGLCLILLVGIVISLFNQKSFLKPKLAKEIGLQIWKNECGGKKEGLTSWNPGEEFASLGIGHFIWYPEGKEGIFKETFPELLLFFKEQKVPLPSWLETAKGCPYQSREEFQSALQQGPLAQLREILAQHVDLQIQFMVQRLNRALPALVETAPEHLHFHLTYQFNRLANTPGGLFVLLDYLNFKGEGTKTHESYQGQGWGLLQVLEQLHGTEPGQAALEEFIEAAKKILSLRVENSPQERGEKRWLKGWHNRLESDREFSKKLVDGLKE